MRVKSLEETSLGKADVGELQFHPKLWNICENDGNKRKWKVGDECGGLGPYEHLKIYNSLKSLGWQIHQTGLIEQCSHELLRHAISIGRTVTYSTLLTVICISTTVTMKKLKTHSLILMGGPSGMVSGLAGNTCP